MEWYMCHFQQRYGMATEYCALVVEKYSRNGCSVTTNQQAFRIRSGFG